MTLPIEVIKRATQHAKLSHEVSTHPNIGVCFDGKEYHYYKEDQWVQPTGNLMPWSMPKWPRIAVVTPEGKVTYD